MARDPRIDPVPGDEIARDIPSALQGIILRKVERAHGGFVGYYRDNGHKAVWKIERLAEWRRWARTAEIIEVAGTANETETDHDSTPEVSKK